MIYIQGKTRFLEKLTLVSRNTGVWSDAVKRFSWVISACEPPHAHLTMARALVMHMLYLDWLKHRLRNNAEVWTTLPSFNNECESKHHNQTKVKDTWPEISQNYLELLGESFPTTIRKWLLPIAIYNKTIQYLSKTSHSCITGTARKVGLALIHVVCPHLVNWNKAARKRVFHCKCLIE